MMDQTKTFTYIINSFNSNITGTGASANDCQIRLGGLPNYKKFKCHVSNFILNVNSIVPPTVGNNAYQLVKPDYITLIVDNFPFLNSVEYPKKFETMAQVLSAIGAATHREAITFDCANFNGMLISFQLVQPDSTLVPNNWMNHPTDLAPTAGTIGVKGVATNWTLTLQMTPIVE